MEVLVDGRQIRFWFMRHGQKPGPTADDITEFGARQIEASVNAHLMGAGITLAFRSNTLRNQKSMGIACKMLFIEEGATIHPLVDIKVPNVEHLPTTDFHSMEVGLQELHGGSLATHHWFSAWPMAWMFRARLLAFMAEVSNRYPHHGMNVLVGSHSPLAELAVPDPTDVPGLKTADIIRYTVIGPEPHTYDEVQIVGVDRFDCPLRP